MEVQCLQIDTIAWQGNGFWATGHGSVDDVPTTVTARRILLATGVSDILPALPGFRELWWRGVLHCPYCHGWEVRGQPLAVYGQGRTVTDLALLVRHWSPDVIVVTDGPGHLMPNARWQLRLRKIGVREEPVVRLIGSPTHGLHCIEFVDGSQLERVALFLHAPSTSAARWRRRWALG